MDFFSHLELRSVGGKCEDEGISLVGAFVPGPKQHQFGGVWLAHLYHLRWYQSTISHVFEACPNSIPGK